jgi:prophage antirepressor-like protein
MVKEIYDILAPNNASVAVKRMNGREKSWVGRTDLGLNPGSLIVVINEPGLYRTIFQSRKPVVRSFKRRAYHGVVPTLNFEGDTVRHQLQKITSVVLKPLPE